MTSKQNASPTMKNDSPSMIHHFKRFGSCFKRSVKKKDLLTEGEYKVSKTDAALGPLRLNPRCRNEMYRVSKTRRALAERPKIIMVCWVDDGHGVGPDHHRAFSK